MKAILTVSLDIMLVYTIVAIALVMWPPVTIVAFCLKSFILMLNTILHITNWWLKCTLTSHLVRLQIPLRHSQSLWILHLSTRHKHSLHPGDKAAPHSLGV